MLPLTLLLFACQRPPPAPEGLDESARYMLREFYGDDDTVAAGLTGYLAWFEAEGEALVGVTATSDTIEGWTLADITADDIAHLPMPDDDRDLAAANGVVGLGLTDCPLETQVALLVRSDQDVVFEGSFDAYEREYLSDRDTFEAANASGELPTTDEPVPVGEDGADATGLEDVLLRTDNRPTATAIGVTIAYHLPMDWRQGVYDVHGEPVRAAIAVSWVPEVAVGDNGRTTLVQQYGVDVNVARDDGRTLRLFASWLEVQDGPVDNDSPLIPTAQVNQMGDAAKRLSDICNGDVTLPPE